MNTFDNVSIMNDKYSYLCKKLKKVECTNMCKEYALVLNKPIQCGTCFWNDITLPPEQVPECSKCVEDTNKVKELLKDNKDKIECEYNCCKSCLWFDYFDYKRNNLAKIKGKELIVIKNKEKKDKKDKIKEEKVDKNIKKEIEKNIKENKSNKHNKHNKNKKKNK
jgi:hypothetical protein